MGRLGSHTRRAAARGVASLRPRGRRTSALHLPACATFEPLGIDEAVSEAWALLVSKLRAAKLRVPINDSWIAATAVAHGIAILTQDNDYAAMPDVEVITI